MLHIESYLELCLSGSTLIKPNFGGKCLVYSLLPISCLSFCLSNASLTSICDERRPSNLTCSVDRSVVLFVTWERRSSTALNSK